MSNVSPHCEWISRADVERLAAAAFEYCVRARLVHDTAQAGADTDAPELVDRDLVESMCEAFMLRLEQFAFERQRPGFSAWQQKYLDRQAEFVGETPLENPEIPFSEITHRRASQNETTASNPGRPRRRWQGAAFDRRWSEA